MGGRGCGVLASFESSTQRRTSARDATPPTPPPLSSGRAGPRVVAEYRVLRAPRRGPIAHARLARRPTPRSASERDFCVFGLVIDCGPNGIPGRRRARKTRGVVIVLRLTIDGRTIAYIRVYMRLAYGRNARACACAQRTSVSVSVFSVCLALFLSVSPRVSLSRRFSVTATVFVSVRLVGRALLRALPSRACVRRDHAWRTRTACRWTDVQMDR